MKAILFFVLATILLGCTTHNKTKTTDLQSQNAPLINSQFFDESLIKLDSSVKIVVPLAKKYLGGNILVKDSLSDALKQYSEALELTNYQGINAEQEKIKRKIVMGYIRTFTQSERAKISQDFPYNYDAGLD